MNRWLLIVVVLPFFFVSWQKPTAKITRSKEEAVSLKPTADTLKLNDMIFSDFISPNGDGYNDHFVIVNVSNYSGNSLQIYNRWGEVIYQANPYNNEWEGTCNKGPLKDNKVTDGVYFFEFYDGIGNNVSGKITVKR